MAVSELSKCRICLQENLNMKLLSSDYFINGELLIISDIIMFSTCLKVLLSFIIIVILIYFSIDIIKITEHDKYPSYICGACLKDADTSFLFKKRCEQSETILQSLLKTENNKENEGKINFEEKNNFEEKSSFEEKSNFEEENIFEDRNFEDKSQNSDKFNFYILNSDKLGNSSINLRSMRRSKNTSQNSKQSYKDDDDDNDDFNESFDNNYENYDESDENSKEEPKIKEISGFTILKYAKEKNPNGVLECICCNETFQDVSNMRAHMHSHKIFKCKICNKKFTILSNLRRHLRKSHAAKAKTDEDDNDDEVLQFKCIGCEATFPRRKLLSEHLKAHKDFVCRICKAKFTFATNLRKHLYLHKRQIRVWRHIPSEKRTCDVCFKVFKYRPSMLKHRKKHDSSGKECQFCAQVFENSIKLYKHMDENHEDRKNIVCQTCGKKFFREWNLKMHMIVHTGAKPFMCEICGTSFALQGNLVSLKKYCTKKKIN